MRPDNTTVANGSGPADLSKAFQVVTKFDDRIYIGLSQYQYDMGLPYIQDANRILVAQALANLGYPKEVHKIPLVSAKKDAKKKK